MESTDDISRIIPKKRGCRAQICMLILALLFFLVGCRLVPDPVEYILSAGSVFCILVCLREIFVRICLFFEELNHLSSRYENDLFCLIRNVRTFSNRFYVTVIISSMFLFSIYSQNKKIQDFGLWANICAILGAQMIGTVIELDYGPLYEALTLEKLSGLNYGASMAYSYFHGYLKIVLPNQGDELPGIHRLMRLFESREQVSFAHNKLIILLPMSLYSPPNLEDHSRIINLAQSLDTIELSRGGVHKRVFKSTAYKIITPTGKRLYVCAEYATPLTTLQNIISNNNEHAELYKKHKSELIIQFYFTLKQILENAPECNGCYDLLLFNDRISNNTYRDVGEVILDHLRNQQRL